MKIVYADNFSRVQYAQALALNWRVQLPPDKYVYEVMLTNHCIHAAGRDTCGECKVVKHPTPQGRGLVKASPA